MKASIIAIGDELLAGLIVDTNTPFLADALRAEGVEVVSVLSAPDDPAAIRTALERASSDAGLVVTTGGLGPTADDLTTAAVAEFVGVSLELDEASLAGIAERFRSRGLEMPVSNRKQAMLPAGSMLIPNRFGTAPGFICQLARAGRRTTVASLPGVPREMEQMARDTLLAAVRGMGARRVFASRVFNVSGLSESKLGELLDGVAAPDEARLAYRAAFPALQARVTVEGPSAPELEERLQRIEARVRDRLGDSLYATGDMRLEEAAGQLLRERGLTLAVAESCTGGLIGHRITDVPGSSAYFLGGVVAYADQVKVGTLGVSADTLAEHGAVSTQVAEQMAEAVRSSLGADLGIATTGIAGPGGGSPLKPVGTVCVALASESGRWSRRYDLGSAERDRVKGLTAQLALDAARRWLLGRLPA